MRRATAAAAVAVLLGAGAVPAAAGVPRSAQILLQRGITGLRIGATPSEARAALGPGVRRTVVDTTRGQFIRLSVPGISAVHPTGGTVTSVEVRTRAVRTAAGAGVGSTRAEVQDLVPGVRCDSDHCVLGQEVAGRRVTGFFLRSGRVASVIVGIVLD